jgi:uncharacterized membrane protein
MSDMTKHPDHIGHLLDRLNMLLKRQDEFRREIDELTSEIRRLKSLSEQKADAGQPIREMQSEKAQTEEKASVKKQEFQVDPQHMQAKPLQGESKSDRKADRFIKSNLEKFIGENLANKIGIIITVIGVAIGVKFAIDRELISPLIRIILGYLSGFILLGFAIRLKSKYENYSSVLLSGAVAIMYFITYAAYGFYGLIPQAAAFTLMVLLTAFTVLAALHYNRQVIAHIGLVGSYAIPFILGEGFENLAFLFIYMTIVNAGILAVAVVRYWKPLYYSSFGITWLIYVAWFIPGYSVSVNFNIALVFLSVFFVIFYLIFLSYKLIRKEKFVADDVLLLLVNSFIFFGLGYKILNSHATGNNYLGLFAIINALVHFAVSLVMKRDKLVDRNLFYLVSGLALVFVTIAIPIQLDGRWVTLLWAGEAAVLFRIGRSNQVKIYENLSYPLMILAFISIVHDWSFVYHDYYSGRQDSFLVPVFNINFFTSLIFVIFFAFINVTDFRIKPAPADADSESLRRIFRIISPAILLVVIYVSFRMELKNYWQHLYTASRVETAGEGTYGAGPFYMNQDLQKFMTLWLINYSLLFLSVLSIINIRKIKSNELGTINLVFNLLVLIIFLTRGLYTLSELRESYLSQSLAAYYNRGIFHILMRYVSFSFAGLTLYVSSRYVRQAFLKEDLKIVFELLFHLILLWVASSELINWMDIFKAEQSYKFGLSILWGVYSLLLISLGIWKGSKHLRIGAIVLFGATLLKLFFYDISHLSTLSKTIVFIALGILLLIISFLYNKYKHLIFDEDRNEPL